jgi:hypothetical protein
MKKMAENLAAHLQEIVMVGGAAAVAVGVGMLSLPWGFIVGGALAIAGGVLSILGREGDGR